ncbi:MAG: hypothetical protein ABIJ92_02830 [Candidatus Aenigmatarchaeota archaeon]
MRKGQAAIMEQVFLVLFIVIAVIVLVLFLTGWQILQSSGDKQTIINDRALNMLKYFSSSPHFTQDKYVLDASKLTAANQTTCEELNILFGRNWFVVVEKWKETGNPVPCEYSNWDSCDIWNICDKNRSKKVTAYEVPVNIYVSSQPERYDTFLGTIRAGVYT